MKPISKHAMLIATLIVLSGCAGKQRPAAPYDQLALSSYPYLIANHYPPRRSFAGSGPGFMTPGLLLPLIEYEAARLERDLRLQDPAPYLKDRLVNVLQATFKLTNVRSAAEYPQNINIALETHSEAVRNWNSGDGKVAWKPEWDNETPCVSSPGFACGPEDEPRLTRLRLNRTLKETFPSGIVLEVQTTSWRLESPPRVVYEATTRLFRLADSVVIGRRSCRGFGEVRRSEVPNLDERTHPTVGQPLDQVMMEELKANDGKLLKAKLREAAEACADSLLRANFGIVSQPEG